MAELSDTAGAAQQDLLQGCARGDRAAFRALYDSTAPQLYAVLIRILGKPDLAEDALHDVFIRIWQNAASYQPRKGAPLAWMISIARYRALDLLRGRLTRRTADAGDDLIADIASPEPGPLAITELAVDGRALRACLEQLSAGQQKSIRLAYLSGYTHEQIAISLESPVGTVKSWVRRGLAALRNCLDR